MPASWLRRRRLGRLDVSVIGALVLLGWDVVELNRPGVSGHFTLNRPGDSVFKFSELLRSGLAARPLCLSVFAKSFPSGAAEGASWNRKERRSADTG